MDAVAIARPPSRRAFKRTRAMADPNEMQMQLMHEAVLGLLSRALEPTTRFPENGYRRRIYFKGMARMGEDLTLISAAAAALVRTAGADLETGKAPPR